MIKQLIQKVLNCIQFFRKLVADSSNGIYNAAQVKNSPTITFSFQENSTGKTIGDDATSIVGKTFAVHIKIESSDINLVWSFVDVEGFTANSNT